MARTLLLIRNVMIPRKNHFTRAHILIEKERIVRLVKSEYIRYYIRNVDAIYNAQEQIALPAAIDLHVHFREPGQEYKEDWESGSKAAIAGGVCFVVDMPNNVPPINTVEQLLAKAKIAEQKSYVDFDLWMLITSSSESLKARDLCPGFKVYLYNREQFKLFLNEKYPAGTFFIVHAEHPDFIIENGADYDSFEKSRPSKAEIEAVNTVLKIAKERQYRIHITHISTKAALEQIINAKKSGLQITTDITLHHLILTKNYGRKIGARAKCNPPLRSREDRDALIRGLLNGWIDCITTDHAPHSKEEKKSDFKNAPSGIASIEFFMPLIFSLAKKLNLSATKFCKIIEAFSLKPARILKLRNYGKLKPGMFANIVILDSKVAWRIDEDEMISKAKNTPYHGMLVKGKITAVFLRGNLVFDGENFITRKGRWIRRSQ